MSQLSLLGEAPRAVFSPCVMHEGECEGDCVHRRYRYELEWPTGNPMTGGMALFVLANPSTATHLEPDPTVTRCIGYSRLWGYGVCGVANARAWRETDPEKLPPDPQAIGPDNDHHVFEMAKRAKIVVCGWGKLGGLRSMRILEIIREAGKVPHALNLNKDGSPQHPLYLRKDLRPFPMVPR